MANAPTWNRLAESTLGEILGWRHVGVGRASRIVGFALELSPPSEISFNLTQESALAPVMEAIRLVSGWAMLRGVESGVDEAIARSLSTDAPPDVAAALELLHTIELRVLARDEDLSRFDPLQAAADLLNTYEDHELEILERILAKGIRSIPTLEALGQRMNVTREWVRQLEVKVRERLARQLESAQFAIVKRHADSLADQLGTAFAVKELPAEMVPTDGGPLVDELFAHLAGPFVQRDGWFVRTDAGGSVDTLMKEAYESALDGHAAPLDAMRDAIESLGVKAEMVDALIAATPEYRVLDDQIVRWQHMGSRVLGVLHAAGKPMTFEDLLAEVEAAHAGSLRNHLSANQLVKRTKVNEWGLASWEGTPYRKILDHMADELSKGKCSVSELAAMLNAQFDISPVSVAMYAQMHPMFVTAGDVIRLRGENEPYVPTASLEMSGGCYVIDGAWAVAITVDHDLLRGSGRPMPEAFAIHLGLQPGGSGTLHSGERQIKVTWGMAPTFGSLRWVAEQEGLNGGDLLFIRRSTPSEVNFRYVRGHELSSAETIATELALRVGASKPSMDLKRWLGDALGLGAAATPTIPQLRARLLARGQQPLAALLDKAAAGNGVE